MTDSGTAGPRPAHDLRIRGNDMGAPALSLRLRDRTRTGGPDAPSPSGDGGRQTLTLETPSRRACLAWSPATRAASDPSGRLWAFLWGETFPHQELSAVAQRVLDEGDACVGELNGSFVLVLVDTVADSVRVATDRFASRRMFHSAGAGGHVLSTSLSDMPTEGLRLDPAAVGWFLSNGVVNGGRTPFDGVAPLPRASVCRLVGSDMVIERYWEIPPEAEGPPPDLEAVEDTVMAMVRSSMERMLADDPDVWVSLSGGWDSACLLGVLHAVGARDVRCFSYSLGEPEPGSDAWVAAETCRRLGIHHEILQSYEGDLVRHIEINARRGEGVAHVCDEVDAWESLRGRVAEASHPVLFTGEHRHGNSPIRANDPTRRSLPGRMKRFHVAAGLAGLIPSGVFRDLREAVTADMDRLQREADASGGGKGFYYVDQRLPYSLLPWRQHFPGRYMTPRFPFLSYDVVDYLSGIHRETRRGHLFHRAAERNFPAAFQVPRATSSGYRLDLNAEAMRHADALEGLVRETDSRLDDLIPPAVALALVDRIRGGSGRSGRWQRRSRRLVEAVAAAGRKVTRKERTDRGLRFSDAHLLRNLLVLRGALRKG